LATFNSSFNSLSSALQNQAINTILSHPIFADLVNHLNTQNLIDIYSEYITENLILLITDVFNIDLTINEDSFQLVDVQYFNNSPTITIINPTHNYVAYGLYNNNTSSILELVPPNSQVELNLPNTNTEYNLRVMSGENVSNDLFGNLQLEEIEAFNADMVDFMDDSFDFILGPFDSEDNCLIGTANTIYTTINVASECSNTDGAFGAVKCAIDLGFTLFADVLEASDDCDLIELNEVTEKVFELIGEILDTFDGSELIAETATKIQDYYLYENQYELCLYQNNNGVILCDNITEPVTLLTPMDNDTDVTLSGTLNFQAGNNTPSDARANSYFFK